MLQQAWNKIKPYKGILLFFVLLFTANALWKLGIKGDESDLHVYLFNHEISTPFNFMANHIAGATHTILSGLGYDVNLEPYNIIRHANGQAIRVVWACSGIKQSVLFLFIMLLYTGPFVRKLWFIPLGLLVLYIFNIFRIALITAVVKTHPDSFYMLHEIVFKYLYYALMFGLWVWWEEKIRNLKI